MSLKDSIVLITGASSGIGEACARAFAREGAKLILNARREEPIAKLAEALNREHSTDTHLLPFDVSNRSTVEKSLASLPSSWQAIDVIVNNAGLARGLDRFPECDIQDWEEMIDTNIKGLLYVSRLLLPGMIERERGHIINIGSTAGHGTYPRGNVYCGTKAAVRAISEGMKMDLLGTPIRVSSVDPGMVETNFSVVRFRGDTERAKKVYQDLTPLTPEDVAEVVVFCAARPPHVNIADVVLTCTDQAGSMLFNRRQ